MVIHYIIMSSSYTDGMRIALDITDKSKLNSEELTKTIRNIKSVCGDDVPLSTHLIKTKDDSWSSVAEYDPFFSDVQCIETEEEFSQKIKKDRVLKGLDVATYILSKTDCTHLSLEKLVYYAYADYLCDYSEKLFVDKIYAFRHGPVVESVYKTYRKSGKQYVQPLIFGDDSGIKTGVREMVARSRILFAHSGIDKLRSIDKTIEKYSGYSPRELVELTHRNGTPWSHIDSTKAYQVIDDELIKKHHHIECV